MKYSDALRYQLPVVLWILTILSLSSIPSIPEVKFPVSPDKLAHVGIYFILCLLWKRALTHQEMFPMLRRHALAFAVGLTVVHGILDELYQRSVPGRSSDPFDAMADALGALLFVVWVRWRQKRTSEGRGI